MNKLKITCLASLLVTGLAHAANGSLPCDGFEIKIKNLLANDLLITHMSLSGAQITPGGLQKINSKNSQVFTVNQSTKGRTMQGNIVLHTISLPIKEVKIQFDLKNAKLYCEHSERSPQSDYDVSKLRLMGKVNYTISNR